MHCWKSRMRQGVFCQYTYIRGMQWTMGELLCCFCISEIVCACINMQEWVHNSESLSVVTINIGITIPSGNLFHTSCTKNLLETTVTTPYIRGCVQCCIPRRMVSSKNQSYSFAQRTERWHRVMGCWHLAFHRNNHRKVHIFRSELLGNMWNIIFGN